MIDPSFFQEKGDCGEKAISSPVLTGEIAPFQTICSISVFRDMLKDLLRQGDMMAKIDSKDSLLRGANKLASQEVPEVQVGRDDVSVQLPTFWAVM